MSAAPAQGAPSNFNAMTRRKIMPFGSMAKITGGAQTTYLTLPRTGYLARLFLAIRGSITSGGLSGLNALGKSSIIRRVRVTLNSGLDVFNVSGPGYHYLIRQAFDQSGIDPVSQSDARSAVATGVYNLDMILPIAMNLRDPIGLLLLQSESTLVQLSIDWEADSAIATGVTTNTATCTVFGEVFTVPPSATDQPPTNVIHQVLEESTAVAGAGAFTYIWPRGGIYLQLFQGVGMGVSGADNFTRYQVRAAQSDYLQDTDAQYLDMEKVFVTGLARLAGTVPFDLYFTTGLGAYDSMRDTIDTSRLTDLASVITMSGAGTVYSQRRQLLVVQ